ncbi:MAG: molybdenum cofactor biosynthesis protein MoaE [Pseudomonadota bacterium]
MQIKIIDKNFDPWVALSDYEKTQQQGGKNGATAVFVGTMRDFSQVTDIKQKDNQQQAVTEMFLEHYPGMTESYLEKISKQLSDKHQLMDVLVIHRVGHIKPDESIVLVAVWSAHRKQAFEASRELMEELKSKAPFWKKETLENGNQHWVEHNTKGY